jgi:hypothetical protein
MPMNGEKDSELAAGRGEGVRASGPEAIEPRVNYTAEDVARVVFRHSVRWFRAQRRTLEVEGFPPPISKVGHPRWHGEELLAWLHRPKDLQAAANVVELRPVDPPGAGTAAAPRRSANTRIGGAVLPPIDDAKPARPRPWNWNTSKPRGSSR